MIKAVIDTNIFVSALIGGQVSHKLLTALKEEKYRLIISPELLAELGYVLSRPQFNLKPTEVNNIILFLETRSQFIKIARKVNICRDPEDNKVLETALSGAVDFIVTGDKDLLIITFPKYNKVPIGKQFHSIPIITPRQFITILHL